MNFTANGRQYTVDEFGVIVQTDAKPFKYGYQYSAKYDTPDYQKGSATLQGLRFGFVVGVYRALHHRYPATLLDVGYGNGDFMKLARRHISTVYGKDIGDYPVPENCIRVENYVPAKIITFWDCLEHIHDLSFLQDLECELLVVSLPYCHFKDYGVRWLETQYKHFKPDEHVRHFDPASLSAMMDSYGWQEVARSTHEDVVRVSAHERQNILTMAFVKNVF